MINFVKSISEINGGDGDYSLIFYEHGRVINEGSKSGPSWQDIILSGNTALTLVNAKENGINYLKLFGDTEQLAENYIDSVTLDGKCEQNGTPTPTVPIDIVCNNGAIKYSANMANVNEQTALVGYYISSSGVITADLFNWIYQEYIPVLPNTTYTLSFNTPVYYVTISEYTTASDSGFVIRKAGQTGNNTKLTITTGSTTNFVRFGTNIDRVEVTLERVLAINWMLNVGNSMAYQPYVEGGIYTDGTAETITDNVGNVATAEMLLKVGDYQDEQNVINGHITRNVGIKVLDGTENWTTSGNLFYAGIATDALEDTHSCYCTHFKGVATNVSASYNNEIKVGTNLTQTVNWTRVQIYPVVGTYSNVTAFKQYLADQYNAGTPVIIVYPTSSATTETVSGQQLNKEPLTVTGSLTGLVANVVSSTHTTPTPTQPLPINCNNGVVKVNSQGQIYTDGTVETVEVTGKNLLDLANCIDGYYYNPDGVYSEASSARLSNFVQVKANETYTVFVYGLKGSANVRVNLFDKNKTWLSQQATPSTLNQYTAITVTATQDGYLAFSANFVTTGSCIDWTVSQIIKGSYTVATMPEYEPYYNGGSATAKMLLKVGDYQDEQSVLDGQVTRNVGIKVLNGSEDNYARRSDYAINYTGLTGRVYGVGIYGMCSHFICSASNASTAPVNSLFFNTSNNYLHFFTEYGGDVASFKAWLTAQYQAGHPVVIIYPLATATTETVESQALTIQAGTNTVEITQASIDNLGLEVSYKGTV